MRLTETRVGRRRRRYATFAGCAAALMLIGVVTIDLRRRPNAAATLQSSSAVLQPVQRVLPDGSIVELKSDAEIAVDFSGPERRVEVKRSEAHFQVVKNSRRPFVVIAARVEVRAVGTSFSVGVGQQAVEVLVTEGRVTVVSPANVLSDAQPFIEPTVVDAGSRAVVAVAPQPAAITAPQVSPISDTEMRERLSWRVPRLEFVGTPLSEAIPMFNQQSSRWHSARIVLGDPDLGPLQLSGILRADNTDTLLRVLATEFGIKGERLAGDVIVLRKN